MEESQLLPFTKPQKNTLGYRDALLLKEGSLSRLYRVSKGGKYFIIKTAKDDSDAMRGLIWREYELSLNLSSHPHIINVFTFEDNTPVGPGVVLEYIDGRDLKEFLAENPSTQLRERVLQQLLSAVSYLHTKGIIHNDIKPENILISRTDNSVKLIDFGLSDSDAHYVYKTLGCSPQYASPELLHQEKLDARSDIYSLGLIIRSLLGGKATRIANKCCAINKKDRYANVEQLTKALLQRRLPLWMALGSVLGIALIHGGTLLLREMNELRLYKSEKEQMQARCDSVYLATEARVQALLAELDANSQDIPYREFVNAELKKLQQGIVDLRESWSKVTDDPVLISSFEHHLWQEHNKHISIFLARAAALPEFTYSKLPREEKQFYLSLLSAGEPYRPYQK